MNDVKKKNMYLAKTDVIRNTTQYKEPNETKQEKHILSIHVLSDRFIHAFVGCVSCCQGHVFLLQFLIQ